MIKEFGVVHDGDSSVERVSVEIRLLIACPERRLFWDPESEPAACEDPGHDHQTCRVHRHRDSVTLPDGSVVTAASWDPRAHEPAQRPDHGVYLDRRWSPPWSHDHVEWPDFGLPVDRDAFLTTSADLLDRARSGQRVEIGCVGGHGRTGTALAALAVLTGLPADEAVDWVRMSYCAEAIETKEQQLFVAGLRDRIAGGTS